MHGARPAVQAVDLIAASVGNVANGVTAFVADTRIQVAAAVLGVAMVVPPLLVVAWKFVVPMVCNTVLAGWRRLGAGGT